jgi:transposase
MTRRFDAEFKARAVRLVLDHVAEYGSVTKTSEVVGRQLGVGRETLRTWVRQAQVDTGARDGVSSAELAEVKALKAKVRRLEEDNAILKAAATFFAGELDPRSR